MDDYPTHAGRGQRVHLYQPDRSVLNDWEAGHGVAGYAVICLLFAWSKTLVAAAAAAAASYTAANDAGGDGGIGRWTPA